MTLGVSPLTNVLCRIYIDIFYRQSTYRQCLKCFLKNCVHKDGLSGFFFSFRCLDCHQMYILTIRKKTIIINFQFLKMAA